MGFSVLGVHLQREYGQKGGEYLMATKKAAKKPAKKAAKKTAKKK